MNAVSTSPKHICSTEQDGKNLGSSLFVRSARNGDRVVVLHEGALRRNHGDAVGLTRAPAREPDGQQGGVSLMHLQDMPIGTSFSP